MHFVHETIALRPRADVHIGSTGWVSYRVPFSLFLLASGASCACKPPCEQKNPPAKLIENKRTSTHSKDFLQENACGYEIISTFALAFPRKYNRRKAQELTCRIRLVVQDAALSRRRSGVRLPYAVPTTKAENFGSQPSSFPLCAENSSPLHGERCACHCTTGLHHAAAHAS